ncbi:hypothetical protein [Sorangium sp. So ce233]|uniref:hypothetical protein n=1 Tax=Sorangium sp. So ce233 TaxID=3133290 RepID=UPI003F62FD3F
MFLGSVTMATSFIRPLQVGHSRTSSANVRRKSSARFVDRPIAATLAFRSGVFVRLRRLLWLRDAGREAAQERERIHVHRDSPVSEGALEREPRQAVIATGAIIVVAVALDRVRRARGARAGVR